MKAPDARSELRPPDPQEVEGLGIDNVEDAATVHEYFSEARIGDDEIDDERVDSMVRDVVRMVITIEGDSRFGPVEEEGGRQLHGEDLLTLSLPLARGVMCRGSPVNHEAVMDFGKPLIFVVIFLLGVLYLVILLDA
jgi:hypothetical protein